MVLYVLLPSFFCFYLYFNLHQQHTHTHQLWPTIAQISFACYIVYCLNSTFEFHVLLGKLHTHVYWLCVRHLSEPYVHWININVSEKKNLHMLAFFLYFRLFAYFSSSLKYWMNRNEKCHGSVPFEVLVYLNIQCLHKVGIFLNWTNPFSEVQTLNRRFCFWNCTSFLKIELVPVFRISTASTKLSNLHNLSPLWKSIEIITSKRAIENIRNYGCNEQIL